MSVLVLILILTVVNVSIRVVPTFFVGKLELPENFVAFLNYIPIAALGVLVFPGILTAVETPTQGLLAGVFAAALGILRVPLFFIVVLSVAFVYVLMLLP
ncbi:hypothetical protein GCM10007358_13610 [Phocicoccus schoeneichii]|uniref:Branched-chain amino acid transport protein (AzlD) n=1 Tax=Phocicoccus schoeneichii TaxID=1812261 RepID=A0A6V7R4F9_9BACL|nr:AzlD domain-containing protein [Jeotgalicoccus schoeneichii]GGH53841.1 hypothetical protein GCM10007358_13610 [Jeotgalicoccus schoeneichii]CAD2072216.1 hypothetical protein JEOSCH030_00229 [Jeotgalicoccus schoeneichii]